MVGCREEGDKGDNKLGTKKMQLYDMTYVFMVQDRAFTPMAIVVLADVIF